MKLLLTIASFEDHEIWKVKSINGKLKSKFVECGWIFKKIRLSFIFHFFLFANSVSK